MHQFKINAKSAFTGDVWQWHQDYGTWKRDDGMPQPRAMNIAIFLDEVMPINGPLMLVPKSQHAGDLKASHDLETTSYPLWTLDEATVTRLVKEGGIVAPTGKAGGMLMFHGNLVHGSSRQHHALSAQDRLSDAERGFELHPHPDAAGIHRPSRFHADPDRRRRRAAAAGARASPGGGVAAFAPSFRGVRDSGEPGISCITLTSGFRVCAQRAHPGMTSQSDLPHEPSSPPQRPPCGRQDRCASR